mmetsp:Transcript_59284/g.94092  ORF Transcript_59284/g.94092 Transcript_59284/m.94092 type:complete len:354 (+) Transcript_59284:128-1189(+)
MARSSEFLFTFLVRFAFVGHVGTVSSVPSMFRSAAKNLTKSNLSSAHNFPLKNILAPQNHSALSKLQQVPKEIGFPFLVRTLFESRWGIEQLGSTAKIMSLFLFILLLAGLLWLCFQSEDARTPPISPSRTPRSLSHDEALKLSENAWPRAYLSANEDEKKALELLLLCNIIQPDEFANGDVSDEHVDECMWIAMQMLRQKDYVYWTRNPLHAARVFDETVTSRFAERTVARSSVSTSGMVTPEFAASYAASERGVMDCLSKPMTPSISEPASPPLPQFYRRDIANIQIKKVQVRCEELATGDVQDLTPRCMIRALQGMPSPPGGGRFIWPEGASLPPSQDTVITLGGSHNPV